MTVFQIASATTFHKFMLSGRTSPALMSGIVQGSAEEAEYVVKLKGGLDVPRDGLVCELVASVLAGHFGIRHPQPALIEIDRDLAELVAVQEPEKAVLMRKSVGVNFASALLTNLVTWPVDRVPAASQFEAACEIFAFDMLIQNPDRRYNNPNLGTVGDHLYIFDHELAFSFLYQIFPNPNPWVISGQELWSQHVLFNGLKRKQLSLDNFFEKLVTLPPDLFDAVRESLPAEWLERLLPAITTHLDLIASHAMAFRNQIVERLI